MSVGKVPVSELLCTSSVSSSGIAEIEGIEPLTDVFAMMSDLDGTQTKCTHISYARSPLQHSHDVAGVTHVNDESVVSQLGKEPLSELELKSKDLQYLHATRATHQRGMTLVVRSESRHFKLNPDLESSSSPLLLLGSVSIFKKQTMSFITCGRGTLRKKTKQRIEHIESVRKKTFTSITP